MYKVCLHASEQGAYIAALALDNYAIPTSRVLVIDLPTSSTTSAFVDKSISMQEKIFREFSFPRMFPEYS